MLKDKGFYDEHYNRSSSGFSNNYELQKYGKVVYDQASDLMWQQSGTSTYMPYAKAKEYVAELNNDQFAGYNDWRLPTLEEAMSLMEPTRKNGDLYIESVFDKTQKDIWTSDLYGASSAWVVHFGGGGCGNFGFRHGMYVRAVR